MWFLRSIVSCLGRWSHRLHLPNISADAVRFVSLLSPQFVWVLLSVFPDCSLSLSEGPKIQFGAPLIASKTDESGRHTRDCGPRHPSTGNWNSQRWKMASRVNNRSRWLSSGNKRSTVRYMVHSVTSLPFSEFLLKLRRRCILMKHSTISFLILKKLAERKSIFEVPQLAVSSKFIVWRRFVVEFHRHSTEPVGCNG